MNNILLSGTTTASQPLTEIDNCVVTPQQTNSNKPINNKPISSYSATQKTEKQFLIDYIKHKIRLIDNLKINFNIEGSYGSLSKKLKISGADILVKNINFSENCAILSSAIFDCLTDPDNLSFLGDDFCIKLVGIDSDTCLKTFRNSKKPTENKKINSFYHCYLVIEPAKFKTKIIVDPTTSNYRIDQNLFIGCIQDLLLSIKELITEKREYCKHKLPLHNGNIKAFLKLNQFIFEGKGNANSIALYFKKAWYG